MKDNRIPVLLDGDPGHDDAIAWTLANARPELDIRAVTSVCGNQTIQNTTYNAQRIMTLIGCHAPLAAGRVKPLIADSIISTAVHGKTGLDGPVLPEPAFEPVKMDAVSLMEKTIRESRKPVTIVATGPLTNVAALFILYPELKKNIAHISLMGGGLAYGNWTPAAEFNILVDPEAADVVFKSGIPITMAGLDVTEKALVYPEDFNRIRAVGNPVASVVADWLEFFYGFHRKMGYPGAPVHDAVAVAALVAPEIMEMHDYHVEIETTGTYCRGMTVCDRYNSLKRKANVKAIMNIDRRKFVDLLVQAAMHYGEVKQ